MSTEAESVKNYHKACRAGGDAEIGKLLREILHPDVTLCIPDRLPFGGTIKGADAVIQHLELLRSFQATDSLSDNRDQVLDDVPVIVYLRKLYWAWQTLAEYGVLPAEDTEVSEWWYFKEGQVYEILMFCFSVGLVANSPRHMGKPLAVNSFPDSVVLTPGPVVYGHNRQTSENQKLIEELYALGKSGQLMDVSKYFDDDLILYESRALPYGADTHRGLEDVMTVIGNVDVCFNATMIDVQAIVSDGDHVSVLVNTQLSGAGERVLLNEDFHLRNNKVVWFRAYYWETSAVIRHWNEMKLGG